jgi:hypothetical protein
LVRGHRYAMHNAISAMAMIRKQVYIQPRHERMLKRRARQLGVTESEIIRAALDRVETITVAGRQALRFMRALGSSLRKPPRGRTWRRESLYEDRINRWTRSGSISSR